MGNLLIFPVTDDCEFLLVNEKGQGSNDGDCATFLATSEKFSEKFGQAVDRLPFIHEDDFLTELQKYLHKNKIKRVFSPVLAVHRFLERASADMLIDVKMATESPLDQQATRYKNLIRKSIKVRQVLDGLGLDAGLAPMELAALIQYVSGIYGESSLEKIGALIGVCASGVKGDVLEIGSLVGKSASVLSYMSARMSVGNFLSIDPWNETAAVQKDSPELVQDLSRGLDYDMLHSLFIVNLMLTNRGHSNYFRRTSEEAFLCYKPSWEVSSLELGKTTYTGQASIIHIDGNHDYEHVRFDIENWGGKLAPGGWIIIDDYLWSHGCGPKVAGDEYLRANLESIEMAFVADKSLFLRFR